MQRLGQSADEGADDGAHARPADEDDVQQVQATVVAVTADQTNIDAAAKVSTLVSPRSPRASAPGAAPAASQPVPPLKMSDPADAAVAIAIGSDARAEAAALAAGLDAASTAMLKATAKSQNLSPADISELAASLALPAVPFSRLWAYLKDDKCLIAFAICVSAANGLLFPAFALVLSGFTNAFYDPSNTNVHSSAIDYMIYFFILAAGGFILNFGQNLLFGIFAARFVRRVRYAAYTALLRQEIGFFDLPANAPGRLASRIGQESVLVGKLAGMSLAMTVQMGASLVAGLVIAFDASWRLSLLILASAPLLMVFGMFEMKVRMWFLSTMLSDDEHHKPMHFDATCLALAPTATFFPLPTTVTQAMAGLTGQLTKAFEEAAHVATESMTGVRTVSAFGLQQTMLAKFDAALERPTKLGLRRARFGGVGQGASQFMMFAIYSLCFWSGAQWISQGVLTFQQVCADEDLRHYSGLFTQSRQRHVLVRCHSMHFQLMQSFFAIAMSATGIGMSPSLQRLIDMYCTHPSEFIHRHIYTHNYTRYNAGHASALAVDAGKAEGAKRSLFSLIDRKSLIDAWNANGKMPSSSGDKGCGNFELREVHFSYPNRPDVEVLKGLNLTVEAGTVVAIVGPSGCGKSTVAALLMRMYDATQGTVLVDGVDVRELNVKALRALQGWVQQEAPLFADSIAYNIAYGRQADDKLLPDHGVARDAGSDATVPAGFVVPPDVISAAESANAAEFVNSFKHGYATFVGDRGNQLSGGQKQRIAIAR